MNVDIDFSVNEWSLEEAMDFEDVAKMTCEQAVAVIAKAGFSKDASDEEKAAGMEAMLAIPTRVRAAFVWIAARRQDSSLTFEQVARSFTVEDFYDGMGGKAEAPLEAAPATTTDESAEPSASSAAVPPQKSGE